MGIARLLSLPSNRVQRLAKLGLVELGHGPRSQGIDPI